MVWVEGEKAEAPSDWHKVGIYLVSFWNQGAEKTLPVLPAHLPFHSPQWRRKARCRYLGDLSWVGGGGGCG